MINLHFLFDQIIGTLEVIRMPQNGIRAPGIEALATAFVHNRNLRIIDLNDNTITTAAAKLASAIEKLPKLEIINLESSLVRTKGAIAIARAIVSHKNLQVLNSHIFIRLNFECFFQRNYISDVMICISMVALKLQELLKICHH